MALQVGTRLGSYDVLGTLGAGGMGVVYRARDTKLQREVALKILPEAFAADPERLARFGREAQLLASLNHPNIAQIYGFEDGPTRALVMELVEGDTLADRIARSPRGLPLDEALGIAKQIAEALEAAHAHGVIHRDLKPSNVKVRDDGTVKVLDFGLAKLAGPAEAGHYVPQDGRSVRLQPDLTASPTITTPVMATGVGVILGTAAYMSPEQAKGRRADKRSDIWAFGCVLYEMFTGKRPFDGDDVSDTLASVLKSDPEWNALPPDTPPRVRRLLQRCLTKDVKRRVPDIAVVGYEIEEALAAPVPDSAGSTPPRGSARSSQRSTWLWAAAALLTGAAITGAAAWLSRDATPLPVVRLTATSAAVPLTGLNTFDRDIAISPDGLNVAYAAGTPFELYLRPLDQLDARVLVPRAAPGNVPRFPFFSPDSRSVGFFTGAGQPSLERVGIDGGPSVMIAALSGFPRGASWGADDVIVFATADEKTGLLRVPATGGEPQTLTTPNRERGEADHTLPEVLPGGRGILFTIVPVDTGRPNAIAVLDPSGQYKVLVEGTDPHYLESGHLLYGAGGAIRAIRFDTKRLEVSGSPVPVLQRVSPKASTGAVNAAVARNGTLVYMTGEALGASRSLVWVDRQGREEPLGAPLRAYAYPRISPDGTRVALDIRDQQNDIWVWDLARRTLSRLTFDPGQNRQPVWSPDGRRILFSAERVGGGEENVFWQAADGSGTPERLTEGPGVRLPAAISPDGSRVLLSTGGQPYDITVAVRDSRPHVEPLLNADTYNEQSPEISPDGRWVAYSSNESGRDEVYVRPFPDVAAGRWQISTDGGATPLWSRDGGELFYWVGATGAGNGRIMSASIRTTPSFTSGPPRLVVEGPVLRPQAGRPYDVTPDGRRLLVIKNGTPAAAAPIELVVVLNWFEELRRLVPAN